MSDDFEKDLAQLNLQVDPVWKRLEKFPKWIRDYVHNVSTFVGAEEVQELTYLRDQNRALIKLVAELKRENQRLQRMVEAKKCGILVKPRGCQKGG
jgi:hypothetical protein